MSESARLAAWGFAAVVVIAAIAVLAQFSGKPLETFTFCVFAGVMVCSSLAIVFSQNIVRAATWLLGALGAAAGLYLLLSANFLAAVQLIVYAGGVLILIVFGVMLTARSPYLRFTPKAGEIGVTAVVGLALFIGLTAVMLAGPWPVIAGAKPGSGVSDVSTIGHALLTDYLLPFELVSVLLLAVMIGAAYLASPEKK